MSISRRRIISGGAACAAFAALRGLGAQGLFSNGTEDSPYGALVADPASILDLPAGFSYKVLDRLGDRMTDGLPTPPRPDGMGAFPGPNGTTVLVRNHEMTVSTSSDTGVRLPLAQRYDPGRGGFVRGGTTTLVVSADNQLMFSYATLGGTIRNCAGGTTPWGSWITCEETTLTPLAEPRATKLHGYCFEVRAYAVVPAEPVPLKAMGRFSHEAVAVDPRTGIFYETEDVSSSCFYRFIPSKLEDLRAGGALQAMRLLEFPSGANTTEKFPIGVEFEVDWVPIANVDPAALDTPVNIQAQQQGAVVIRRGEGIFWNAIDQAMYFTATDGGGARSGQIFKYTPLKGRNGNGVLELFVEAPAPDNETSSSGWEWPDNVVVTPWGDLILCEDGPTNQHLYIVNRARQVSRFARNALNRTEFAGACFSADGRTLFVNIYGNDTTPGATLAITGPWHPESLRARRRP